MPTSSWIPPICPHKPRSVFGFRLDPITPPTGNSCQIAYFGNRYIQIWLQIELEITPENALLWLSTAQCHRGTAFDVSDVLEHSMDTPNMILIIERPEDFCVVFNFRKFRTVAKGVFGTEADVHWSWVASRLSPKKKKFPEQFSPVFEVLSFGS